MNPITAGIGIVGLGTSLFFGQRASEDASKVAANEQAQFATQKAVNAQRQSAMELSARRQQMETFRNTQRQRAMGIQAATNQGAQYGSGLAGGTADTQNQGAFAQLGINQNLTIGRNIFGLDNQISDLKAQESQFKSDQATNTQWASLGNSLMQGAGTLGKVATYGAGQIGNAATNMNWLSGGPTGFLST